MIFYIQKILDFSAVQNYCFCTKVEHFISIIIKTKTLIISLYRFPLGEKVIKSKDFHNICRTRERTSSALNDEILLREIPARLECGN